MPDEDSTLATQNQQTSTSQPWDDNDFVIDFGDGENMEEVKNSEEKSDENFEINTDNEENKDSGDTNFNQDDLFGETSENNVDLWDTPLEAENNENNEGNDDIFTEMNLDDWNNTNQDWNTTESLEENNELFSESESNISDADTEDNISLENETETENNQDELFWKTEEENNKIESEETEELHTDLQENKVEDDSDFSMEIDWNGVSLEKNDNISLNENDTLLDNTENNPSDETDNNSEENPDVVSESVEENDWDNLFWEEDQNNDIEWQLNQDQEIEDIQKENDDDKIDFSLDNSDSNEAIQEKDTEATSNPNNLESMFAENWNEAINTIDEEAQTENINDANLEFASDYHDDSNQDEIQNNVEDNEEFWELPQNSDVENIDNDLSSTNSVLQNEGDESENITSSENYESPIQNEELTESNEWNTEDNQNIFQDESFQWNDQSNWEFLLDNGDNMSWEENVNDKVEKNQELPENMDTENVNVQEVAQPDMMNLLWWQPVDFSYEENAAATEQSKTDLEVNQDNSSNDLQDSTSEYENNNPVENSTVEEKSDMNTINNEENAVANNSLQSIDENRDSVNNINTTEPQNQTIEQNTEENTVVETPKTQINESSQNQAEAWSIKSTLSLDEILDSELKSNPQFADNSKSIPKNIKTNSTFFGGKKVSIFAWIWVFLLFCIVVALAFPSISWDRKPEDVVNTGTVVEEPENPVGDINNPKEYTEPEETTQTPEQWSEKEKETEKVKKNHWSGPTTELVEDEPTEDIKPYVEVEPEEPEEPIEEEGSKEISKEDIQSKISSFKSQGEWYKKVGENSLNEKVIKYAAYIVRLCDEYQAQIDNGEWIDTETFSSFETKILWFVSKIEKNLNWWDEVTTIYTKVDFDEDDEKKELRTYLSETR